MHHQKFLYLDSVWRSTFSEFRDYINGITDKSIIIQEALDTIREAKCLPKKYLASRVNNKTITVQDIAYNNKQIAELFNALRKGMQPESINLPFKKIKDRENRFRKCTCQSSSWTFSFRTRHVCLLAPCLYIVRIKWYIE